MQPAKGQTNENPASAAGTGTDLDLAKLGLAGDRAITKSNSIEIPQITLPKGGGAIKGIDEKFSVNPSNGTASFSIPLPLSPNRNGFTPSLAVSYNSGAGNSVLGVGWGLDLPMLQRKTDKNLPCYRDGSEEEDTFMFVGLEDLTPYLEIREGVWQPVAWTTPEGYAVRRYRPRVEGAFSKIERIIHPEHGMYWRVVSKENITTIFGRSPGCRVADPLYPEHIFQWLPELSFDDKGSVVVFKYRAEDGAGVLPDLHERNRRDADGALQCVNQYLKRIKYGNVVAYYPEDTDASPYDPPVPPDNWHFEAVFDYGEHDVQNPGPDTPNTWGIRPDAFSSYRSGFEIRTYRLLRRVLMFHRFTELDAHAATLVRSLDFQYLVSAKHPEQVETELEFLESVTQTGYTRMGAAYSRKSLPPMTFEYRPLVWNKAMKTISAVDLPHTPEGLGGNYQFVDLYNEGIAGIFTEQANGWHYQDNLGDTDNDGKPAFSRARLVTPKPSFMGIGRGVLQLRDLDAAGGKQIVVHDGLLQGYFDLTEDQEWQVFHPFPNITNVDLQNPNVRMIDLNGDGIPEIVLSEENAFCWWEGLGRAGYAAPKRCARPQKEEQGPTIVFSDSEQRIFLADMSGDGLTDLVRITNGAVCYWPNLGYGRFGARISMSNAPLFDHPEQFHPDYLILADISGTGATDLIYLGRNRFRAWLNLSGNRWGTAVEIDPFFSTEYPNRVTVADLLGQGTGCLVWSSPLPAHTRHPMRYIDLMGGQKPHIMTGYRNNMGKEVTISYKSSTWFYLQDKLAGTPWITRLPFPVQCVEKMVLEEKISGLRFASVYTYHHGMYDQTEREFRGFGRVEQHDTETFGELKHSGAGNATIKNLHQPPVLTKTWFHTGAYLDRRDKILGQFEQEYWYNSSFLAESDIQPIEAPLPDARIIVAENASGAISSPEDLSPQEYREALRSCKGMLLRQEVFALDAPITDTTLAELQAQAVPYEVRTHNCCVEVLQPRAGYRYAVFIVKESESVTYTYERNHQDPRVAHSLHIEMDRYGNILESASVVYGRFKTPDEQELDLSTATGGLRACIEATRNAQARVHITYSKTDLTSDMHQTVQTHRLPLPWQSSKFELNNLEEGRPLLSAGRINLFKIADLKGILENPGVTERPYHNTAAISAAPEKRLIEQVQTIYLNDNDLQSPLPPGISGRLGLRYEKYQLAYTPALRAALFASDAVTDATAKVVVTNADMAEGRFVLIDGNWWIRSGLMHYLRPDSPETPADARARFMAPKAYTDPFHSLTLVEHDPYVLFIRQSTDPVGNESTVTLFDYRSLSPLQMRDANDDLSTVLLDELGMVKAMAVMGKGSEADDLAGLTAFTTDADKILTDAFWSAAFQTETDSVLLQQHGRDLLQHASARFVYDFDRYRTSGSDSRFPVVVGSILREEHHQILLARGLLSEQRVQISCEYMDGLGKVVMQKLQAEPGNAKKLVTDPDGNHRVEIIDNGQMRWLGNGRTVFNNKGNALLRYEPYFSVTTAYETAPVLVETGVYTLVTYDALGRAIRTDFPDKTHSRVAFDAWCQTTYDQNDTAANTGWHTKRLAETGTNPVAGGLRRAARSVELHTGTPGHIFLDSLGRPVLTVQHLRDQYGADEKHYTRIELDSEGNTTNVFNARFNVVMRYGYDMLGHKVYQESTDTGKRWTCFNCLGNPLKMWDQRRHLFTCAYDTAHRLIEKRVRGGDGPTPLDHIYEKIEYGEVAPDAKALRLRGKVWRQWDSDGRTAFERYDYKGNNLHSIRRLSRNFQQTANWTNANSETALETESFTSYNRFDAQSRPTLQVAPHSDRLPARRYHFTMAEYNDSGLLQSTSVWLRQNALPTDVPNPVSATFRPIQEIRYNEKAQRTLIRYGNGVSTRYEYDPETLRLIRLRSTGNPGPPERGGGSGLLQDLHYSYDPVGNIVQIWDQAIPTVFFANHRIEPLGQYAYDSLYRLTEATGREHIGQASFNTIDNWSDAWAKAAVSPGETSALREYTQTYRYDAAGNIKEMAHTAHGFSADSWTRSYQYEANNNRLRHTTIGTRSYAPVHHPEHGFITAMPHLSEIVWNFREEIVKTIRSAGADPEATWYAYAANGQRTRKVNTTATGAIRNERLYLGGMEIWRAGSLERETLHIMDGRQQMLMIDLRSAGTDDFDDLTYRYQLSNHLGSVALELDESGSVINYEEYHPYGTTAYQATNTTIRCAAKRYRYTGMERDEETGLEYHSARYYVPWLGRWLNGDPIGIEGGSNLYRYSNNNPVILSDPSGLDARLSVDQRTHTITYSTTNHFFGTQAEIAQFRAAADRTTEFYRSNSGTAVINGTTWTVNYEVAFQYHDTATSPAPAGVTRNVEELNRGIDRIRTQTSAITSLQAIQNDANLSSFQSATSQIRGFRPGDNVIVFADLHELLPGIRPNGGTAPIRPSVSLDITARRQTSYNALVALDRTNNQTEEDLFRTLTHETGHTLGFDERYTVGAGARRHEGFENDFMASRNLSAGFTMDPSQREASARFAVFVADGNNLRNRVARDFEVDDTGLGGNVQQYRNGRTTPDYSSLQRTLRDTMWTRFRSEFAPPRRTIEILPGLNAPPGQDRQMAPGIIELGRITF